MDHQDGRGNPSGDIGCVGGTAPDVELGRRPVRVDHDQPGAVGRVERLVPALEVGRRVARDVRRRHCGRKPDRRRSHRVDRPGKFRLVVAVEHQGRFGLKKQAAHRPISALGGVAQQPPRERPALLGIGRPANPVVDGVEFPIRASIAIGPVSGDGQEVAVIAQSIVVRDPSDHRAGDRAIERLDLVEREDVGEPFLDVEPEQGLEPSSSEGDGPGQHRRVRCRQDNARRRRPQHLRDGVSGQRLDLLARLRAPGRSHDLDRSLPGLRDGNRPGRFRHPDDPGRSERLDKAEGRLDVVEQDREVMRPIPRRDRLQERRQVGHEADLVDDRPIGSLSRLPRGRRLPERLEFRVVERNWHVKARRSRPVGRRLAGRRVVAEGDEPEQHGRPPSSRVLPSHRRVAPGRWEGCSPFRRTRNWVRSGTRNWVRSGTRNWVRSGTRNWVRSGTRNWVRSGMRNWLVPWREGILISRTAHHGRRSRAKSFFEIRFLLKIVAGKPFEHTTGVRLLSGPRIRHNQVVERLDCLRSRLEGRVGFLEATGRSRLEGSLRSWISS